MSLGYNVTEFIAVIDKSIDLYNQLKRAPDEIQTIISSIDHATAFLRAWRPLLEESSDQMSPDQRNLMISTTVQYDNVLTRLGEFVAKHGKLVDGKISGRFSWVIDNYFKDDRSTLEKDLATIEARMGRAIGLNTSMQIHRLERSNSMAQVQPQDDHITTLGRLHQPSLPYNTSLARAQRSLPYRTSPLPHRSPSDALVAERRSQRPAEPASLRSFSEMYLPSPSLPYTQDQQSPYGLPVGSNNENFRDSEIYSEPSTRQSSVFSMPALPSSRSSITQYSPEISPLRPHFGSGRARGMFPGHVWNENIFQQMNRPTDQDFPASHPPQHFASPDLTPTPTNNDQSMPEMVSPLELPPPIIRQLSFQGEIIMWYHHYDPQVSKTEKCWDRLLVKDIEIVEQVGQGTVELDLKCVGVDGAKTGRNFEIKHRGPSNAPDIFQTLIRPKLPTRITSKHPFIKVQLKCGGERVDKNFLEWRRPGGSYKPLHRGQVEYTFTNDEGIQSLFSNAYQTHGRKKFAL
ncbi:hypothetical protein BCR34DRAFT_569384 [Clohesyomyces aquaticus]|uniref:Uncharacterized protein n=1 Tax=Clohesyomyces aquaticus TaxID=1231657 RepID=A0A1Y1ZET0_9PLEO|nr:hypothetical protein BCR34DRAFT_569384 [Clohesyomyces aquaticus]